MEDEEITAPEVDSAPTPAKGGMSNSDMLAYAIAAMAPALLGGALGGKSGAMAGAASGTSAVGGVLKGRADAEANAQAAIAARTQALSDFKTKEDYKASLKPQPVAKDRTRAITVVENGKKVTKIVPDTAGSTFISEVAPEDVNKKTENQDKLYTEMVNKIETPRGNQKVQQAQKALLSIGNAQELIDMYPDPNKMPAQQVNLLNQELAKVASGGVGSEHGQSSLEANTFNQKWQSFLSKSGNEPTGAELGAFIGENKAYLGGLQKVNERVVNDYRKHIFNSYKNRLAPAHVDQFNAEYPDVLAPLVDATHTTSKQAVLPLSPQALQMVDWAKDPANAKDPRLGDVVKKLQAMGAFDQKVTAGK